MKIQIPSKVADRKKKRVKTAIILLSSAALLLPGAEFIGTQAALAASNASNASSVSTSDSDKVLNNFQSLLKANNLRDADIYLNKNIEKTTQHHASLMVLYLENARIKALPILDQKFYPEEIQKELSSIYKRNDHIDNLIKKAKTQKLKKLLIEVKNSGYKMRTSEGMYYLTMDYSRFERYQNNVKDDIAAYITIQMTETDKYASSDAALTIGYQELVNRALIQENFLLEYPTSNRSGQVKTLFNDYKLYVFYGLNNTPLFSYEENTMQPNARKAYEFISQIPNTNKSELRNQLKQFMKLVKEEKYKKTAKVQNWLTENINEKQ
ncbi:hypothetical protein QPK24_03205 [Paenibacillus polygoni]|uniref:Uncharacterized protein n=1 Tax=Paenibacillus polygoni TaxID=3050112 RepID=A0ABY8X707_9BACL|nr:hypothetical protein [Paenibacillus polygoni]WIV19764.1 hypothetical protein QPK24_03205 [Paenibacillus polygoni]